MSAPEPVDPRGGNLAALGMIQVFRLVSGFAVNVMVMRGLGVEGFGVYGYVSILVGLASFGSSMGMDRYLKREIARDETKLGELVATGLAASAALSALTTLGIVAWAWAVDGRPAVVGASALAAVAVGLQALALVPVSAFHAVRRMGLGVRGNLVGRMALVGATATFLALKLGVIAVFTAQILDGAATLAVVWFVYVRQFGTAGLRTRRADVVDLLRTTVPFGLNSLAVSVYLSVDVLMMGQLRDDHEVGVYRGAVMLLSLFPIVADTLSTGLYPRMSRHLGDPEKAGEEMRFLVRILLTLSVPAAVGGVLTARPLMIFLGGQDFAVSALPFQIMAPLLPLRYLNNGFGMGLSALDRQQDRTNGAIFAAIVNVAANLYAIPRYGAAGAATTTLVTEVLLLGFMRWRIGAIMRGLGSAGTLVRVGLPAVAMGVVVWFVPQIHVLLTIAVGVIVYGVGSRLSGAWHPRDLRRLRNV